MGFCEFVFVCFFSSSFIGKLPFLVAHHDYYPCSLKGFAVGSKCVVWTSLKWCDARILEVSEKGTKVSVV